LISDYAPIIQLLHGGVILSLTDTMGSLAIATKGQWMTGVSTDISASFVKPGGKLGDKVLIEGRVVGIGVLFCSDCVSYSLG
jgi:acyl-coenzyme A thioesterase 13